MQIQNLVLQTSQSEGLGNMTLINETGYQNFFDAFGTGGTDTFFYFIRHATLTEWEVGTGHLFDATTLVRDTIISSSNANSAVDFSVGSKDISNDIPASEQLIANGVSINNAGVITSGNAVGGAHQFLGDTSTSISIGTTGTTASSNNTVSIGHTANTTNFNATSVGNFITTSGISATSVGVFNTSSNSGSVTVGNACTSTGFRGVAIGGLVAQATGSDSIAIGTTATAAAAGSIALGLNSNVGGSFANSVALGGAVVNAANQIMLGNGARDILANGSFAARTHSITDTDSPYTANTEMTLFADASTAAITVNLPSSTGIAGRIYSVMKTDSSSNTVSIAANGSETINGAGSITLTTQYDRALLISDGNNFYRFI